MTGVVSEAVEMIMRHIQTVMGPISEDICEIEGDDDRSVLLHNISVLVREVRTRAIEEAVEVCTDYAAALETLKGHPEPLPIDTNEGWRRVQDGALDLATAIRNLKGAGA